MGYTVRIIVNILSVISLFLFYSVAFETVALANEPIINNHIPNRFVISSIGLDSVVMPVGFQTFEMDGQTYGQWMVDDNLVSWHNLSAPLGQVGNTVLNGHSDIGGMVFRDLHLVQVGDVITVFAGEQEYQYQVTETRLVQEVGVSLEQRIANAQLIKPTTDERLTLITCINPGATHRLIVTAHPV